jgi:hypothetical protein
MLFRANIHSQSQSTGELLPDSRAHFLNFVVAWMQMGGMASAGLSESEAELAVSQNFISLGSLHIILPSR